VVVRLVGWLVGQLVGHWVGGLLAHPTAQSNPKTHRKWVWAFIKAIAELIDMVVSANFIVVIYFLITSGQWVLVIVKSITASPPNLDRL
jgi:hypothetical protein